MNRQDYLSKKSFNVSTRTPKGQVNNTYYSNKTKKVAIPKKKNNKNNESE